METSMCAFLRGINLNGRNMKMADVCNIFSQEPVKNVRSILATGNILFESNIERADLRCSLEKRMSEHYGMDIDLIIKDKGEIGNILSSFPFPADPDLHVYVFICEVGFERTLMERFGTITPAINEKAQINGGQFYWQVSKGSTLDSGFSKILGKKRMKDQFTSRNINTMQKIFEKMV